MGGEEEWENGRGGQMGRENKKEEDRWENWTSVVLLAIGMRKGCDFTNSTFFHSTKIFIDLFLFKNIYIF